MTTLTYIEFLDALSVDVDYLTYWVVGEKLYNSVHSMPMIENQVLAHNLVNDLKLVRIGARFRDPMGRGHYGQYAILEGDHLIWRAKDVYAIVDMLAGV